MSSRKFAEFLERHENIIKDNSKHGKLYKMVELLYQEEKKSVSGKWMQKQLFRLVENDYNYNCIANDEDLPREQ